MRNLFFFFILFYTNITYSQLQFSNVANTAGTDFNYGTSTFGGGISFVDFNGDGLDDLTLSSDETQLIKFLQNNGTGFSSITLSGIVSRSRAKQVIWVD